MNSSHNALKRYFSFLTAAFTVYMIAEAAHYFFWGYFFVYLINTLILTMFTAYWAFIKTDSLQIRMFRYYRAALGAAIIFMFFCKCAHDRFFMETDVLVRHSWYAYYIAMILLPLLTYELSLEIDKLPEKRVRIIKTVCRIFAALLIVFIMTNDLHGLAFSFPGGIAEWNRSHKMGIVYWITAAFGIILFVLTIIHVFRQCILPKTKKYIWLPIFPLAVGFIYLITYYLEIDPKISDIRYFALTDTFCFLIIIFVEGCETVYRIGTEIPNEDVLLIHRIRNEIADETAKANDLIESSKVKSDEECRADLYRVGFIQTYAKRTANLILLSEQNGRLEFAELSLSVAESTEYLKLNGIEAMLVANGKRQCSLSEALDTYKKFYETVEPMLDKLGAILIVMNADRNGIKLKISAEDRGGDPL